MSNIQMSSRDYKLIIIYYFCTGRSIKNQQKYAKLIPGS